MGRGCRVLQAEPLLEGAIGEFFLVVPSAKYQFLCGGVGPHHVVAPRPVVGGQALVVEVHGALGHHGLV